MPDAVSAGGVAPAVEDPTQAAPSAELVPGQEQVSQEGTAPTTPPETVQPFNMPPAERWEELRQQKVSAEQRAQQAEAMARMALERVQGSPPVVPVDDPWAGLVNHPDPQTAVFYQQQQRLFQHEARRAASEQNQPVLQAASAVRQELASLKLTQFRTANPDIKPNSPEEQAIAGFIMQGYDLDAAKKLTLYDRLESENQAFKAKQASVGSKVAANQTGPTQGIPATAGLPGRPGDWRENVRQAARKGGSLADIVNAAGATRAE